MAIDMTPEQRTKGEENFKNTAQALDRRGFMKAGVIGAGAAALGGGAAYFGYKTLDGIGGPVRAALIGGGDEGGVLIGEHNPAFLKFVAFADIRPTNVKRSYEGEPAPSPRKGFRHFYGKDCDKPGNVNYIEHFLDWEEMLKRRKDIEAVVIALPLHLHAYASIRAMQIGKERGKPIHVLCEKLMGWNVHQCKQMIKVAKQTGSILSIGHQRHYSMLYDHAQEVLKSDVLGDIKHIRALWHRNFSWPYSHDKKKGEQVSDKQIKHPKLRDGWCQPVTVDDYEAVKDRVKEFGYDNVEQLVRWRLYPETGGGLMAELGSHQMDASSIFLGKVKPLTVQGFGGKLFFGPGKNDRQIDDHIFVTFTFPGKNHPRNPHHKGGDENDVVVVTYSSISTNSFEQYGECLMGTRGTMIVEGEAKVMLYTEKAPGGKGEQRMMDVSVEGKKSGSAKEESSSTWAVGGGPTQTPAGGGAGGPGATISRGYREEMEDFAYCVRLWNQKLGYAKKDGKYEQRLPRCHGEVAMADAIIALGANAAMRKGERLTFKDEWFDGDSTALPEWDEKKEKKPCEVQLG